MTKIGSSTGGIRPPISNDNSNTQAQPSKMEAPMEKFAPTVADTGSASDAKGVMNSQAELMKAKLQENLKTAGDAGKAIPEKWSPAPHPSAPIHPDVHLPGVAMPEKIAPHPSSPPHPDVQLYSSAPPSKLVNENPAAHLTEEKDKK
jgi:hypothetical protein